MLRKVRMRGKIKARKKEKGKRKKEYPLTLVLSPEGRGNYHEG